MATPGIPTTFQHTNFRSRLESRWAAMFDLLGWQWVYEPLDCSGYIPDFLIQGPHPMFVEVGPCITRADYDAKSAKPTSVASELGHDVLVLGVSPLPVMPIDGHGDPVAGLLGEFIPGGECSEDDRAWEIANPDWVEKHQPGHDHTFTAELMFSASAWMRCRECHRVAVFHSVQSYAGRPCGHHDGDHYLGEVAAGSIERLWREAGNRVQWKAA